MHKRIPMVRRYLPLPFGVRRGPDPLLDAPPTAPAATGPGPARGGHDPWRHLLRGMAHLQATGEPIDIPAPAQEHLLRNGDHRREGGDLLTQRQFCALRRGRSRHHRVTITPGHPRPSSGVLNRTPPRRPSPPRNAQNCSPERRRREPRVRLRGGEPCSIRWLAARYLEHTFLWLLW